ncbi:molybdopterin converting factor subunit 1 [Sphingomonas sp.]
MALTVLYFAWVRERVGLAEERVDPPGEVTTPAALAAWLGARSEAHKRALGEADRLRVAIDQRFAAMDESLAGAREIAFFPPVTGG